MSDTDLLFLFKKKDFPKTPQNEEYPFVLDHTVLTNSRQQHQWLVRGVQLAIDWIMLPWQQTWEWEKSRTLYFFLSNKERVKQKEKEAKTTEKQREREMTAECIKAKEERKERKSEARKEGGWEDDVILFPHQWCWLDCGEALAVFIVVSLSSFRRRRSQVRPVVPMRKVIADILMILRGKNTQIKSVKDLVSQHNNLLKSSWDLLF